MKRAIPTMGLLLVICLPTSVFSQAAAGTSRALDPALRKFIQADFMTHMKDLRREAENAVAAFKLEMNNYRPEDIQRVRTGYEKTADRVNQELENIKNDFLNKKKLKYITEFPKDYSRSLELSFKELSEFYSQNFQQALLDVRNSKEDGAIVIAILIELVKLAPQVVNHFREMQEMAARYDDAYLEKYLIAPFKFPAWAEIQAEAGYNNFNNGYNNTYNAYPTTPVNPTYEQANYTPDPANNPAILPDTTQQQGGNWWETNSTLPYTPPAAGADGAAPARQNTAKPSVSKPTTSKPTSNTPPPPPDPFAPAKSDTTKPSAPPVVPVKKNQQMP